MDAFYLRGRAMTTMLVDYSPYPIKASPQFNVLNKNTLPYSGNFF
jgi:hypothetical protein